MNKSRILTTNELNSKPSRFDIFIKSQLFKQLEKLNNCYLEIKDPYGSYYFGEETSDLKLNTISYDTAGTYIVSLAYEEDSTGCKGDTLRALAYVQDYPIAQYTIDTETDSIYCVPQIINFTDNTISTSNVTSRQWIFTDTTLTDAIFPTHNKVFFKNEYETKYIVKTGHGCSDTLFWDFNVVGPDGDFSLSKPGPICQSEVFTVNIKDTSDIDQYAFFFGDGISVENTPIVEHAYDYYPSNDTFSINLRMETIRNDGKENCVITIPKKMTLVNLVAEFEVNYGDTANAYSLETSPCKIRL